MWVGVFLVALVVIIGIIRPFTAAPVAADAAASVLYWNRIVSGERLEAFVNLTPKPLLTLVYGVVHSLTHDWRAVSIVAILVAAAAVTIGARLAHRVGGAVAAVLAGVLLLLDARMLVEVAWAYGLPWFLAAIGGAGLALVSRPPRYGLAGLLLLLGALVRPETFTLLAVATVILVVLAARHRLPPRGLLILVGWGAIPIMLAHDQLLAGDPLHWLRVSALWAGEAGTPSAGRVARALVDMLLSHPAVTVMAAVGVAGAWFAPRARVVAIGIVTVGVGTAAIVLAVGAMGRPIVDHYYSPIWLMMGFSAALGVACTVQTAQSAWDRRRGRVAAARPGATGGRQGPVGDAAGTRQGGVWRVIIPVVAVLIGAVVLRPLLATGGTLSSIDRERAIAAQSDAVGPRLAEMAATMPVPPSVGPRGFPDGATYRILVPRFVLSRLAAHFNLPLTLVGPLVPGRPTHGLIHPGVIVYHDEVLDRGNERARKFEGSSPVVVEGVTFDLVANDPPGTWVWQARD